MAFMFYKTRLLDYNLVSDLFEVIAVTFSFTERKVNCHNFDIYFCSSGAD